MSCIRKALPSLLLAVSAAHNDHVGDDGWSHISDVDDKPQAMHGHHDPGHFDGHDRHGGFQHDYGSFTTSSVANTIKWSADPLTSSSSTQTTENADKWGIGGFDPLNQGHGGFHGGFHGDPQGGFQGEMFEILHNHHNNHKNKNPGHITDPGAAISVARTSSTEKSTKSATAMSSGDHPAESQKGGGGGRLPPFHLGGPKNGVNPPGKEDQPTEAPASTASTSSDPDSSSTSSGPSEKTADPEGGVHGGAFGNINGGPQQGADGGHEQADGASSSTQTSKSSATSMSTSTQTHAIMETAGFHGWMSRVRQRIQSSDSDNKDKRSDDESLSWLQRVWYGRW
ncbi:hypothetical protein GGS21DRAFT_483685 [Xylaria nigripes]|nr:hypothetical protein GGS21DRAFT_483685 [Xylaria nigripes]